MRYKGTPTPLGDIPLGSIVEVLDPTQFQVPKGYSSPLIGVLAKLNPFGYGANATFYPALRLWNGTSLTAPLPFYNAKGDLARYTGLGFPKTSTLLSVMVGSKAAEIAIFQRGNKLDGVRCRDHAPSTVGADPEIFITDPSGVVVPAWTFLPHKRNGANNNPTKTYGTPMEKRYWDGFQAEFTVQSGSCANQVIDSIWRGLTSIRNDARAKDPSYELSLASVLQIPSEMMEACTAEEASLGCLPSLNAYGPSGAGEVVEDPRALPFRFAGGHVHIALSQKSEKEMGEIVKTIDRIVGVASVGMFATLDNPLRRRFYGRAGEFRLPTHGLEYRVLSNAWLCHPAITFWVFDMVRASIGLHQGGHLAALAGTEDEAQRIINELDVPAARKYAQANSNVYTHLTQEYYGPSGSMYVSNSPLSSFNGKNAGEVVQRMINLGVEALVDPVAMAANWYLDKPFECYILKGSGSKEVWQSHAESHGVMFKDLLRLTAERDATLAKPKPTRKGRSATA